MTKLGRQPAADIIRQRGLNRRQLAAQLGVDFNWLNNVLQGRQVPPPWVVRALPALLDEPVTACFTPEALARSPRKKYRLGSSAACGDDTRPRRIKKSAQG